MVWIETKSGLLNLTRLSQVRVTQSTDGGNPYQLKVYTPYQLEVYTDASDYIVLAQGDQAAMMAHYVWIKSLIVAASSGVYSRGGL